MHAIAVRLPASSLWDKDHLNHRWHVKKVTFLAHVMRKLTAHAALQPLIDASSSGLSFVEGDLRRPVLTLSILTSGKKSGSASNHHKYIRLFPCAPPEALSPARLSPEKNCVRTHAEQDMSTSEPTLLPTPHYNQTVLADVLLERVEAQCRLALASSPSMVEGVRLLKIWFRAQGLDGPGTVGGARLVPELIIVRLHTYMHIFYCCPIEPL